jgi:hypothetical protein
MYEKIDRRKFLGTAGAAGVALAVGGATDAGAGPPLALHNPVLAKLAAKKSPSLGGLRRAMRGPVIEPNQSGFIIAAHVYNQRFDNVLPGAVARPLNATDTHKAVGWALANGVPIRARSGGHSYAGYSTQYGGLVLDMRMLSGVSYNKHTGIATIGAGAQLIDVYAALAGYGVTIPAGSCPSVGITGHALGGGMGLAGRAFGLTTDNVVAVQLVTPDGKLQTVSQKNDPDLFWGLRGAGGGNFGVVTAIQVKVHPIPRAASYFFVYWPWSQASAAIDAWQRWAPFAPDAFTSVFHLQTAPGGPQVLVAGQYMGPAGNLGSALRSLTAVPGAQAFSGNQSYFSLQLRWAGCLGQSFASCHTVNTYPGGQLSRAYFDAKSDYVAKPLPAAGRQVLINAMQSRQNMPGSGALLFDSYGGAINRVRPNATAFVHRNVMFCIQYLSYNGGSPWLGSTWGQMRPYVSGQAYQNYTDPSLKGWQHAYYGSNYQRLLALKRAVDPKRVFNFPQAIGR